MGIERRDSKSKSRSKARKRTVPCVRLCIRATFNNTIITITDYKGAVLKSMGTGCCGFKHTRKATPAASQELARTILSDAVVAYGIAEVEIVVNGIGPNRDVAILAIDPVVKEHRLIVRSIWDKTPSVFNGCRARKRRKV